MRAPTILFVDDEADLLDLYRSAFSREGYDVVVAPDIPGARQLLAARGIDLVVLDIRLSGASGLELLREVKASFPAVPVVLSTAFARYQDDFSSWLADAYVVKSSDLTELKQVVNGLLAGNHAPSSDH